MNYLNSQPQIDPKVLEQILRQRINPQASLNNSLYSSYNMTPPVNTGTDLSFQLPPQSQMENEMWGDVPATNPAMSYEEYLKAVGQTEAPSNIDEKGRLLTSGDVVKYGESPETSFLNKLPFLSPTGSSLETELFQLGNALGTPKGTPGRGLTIAGSAGAALFGAGRAGLSGFALAKANEEQNRWMQEQLRKGQTGTYTPAPQYQNTNVLGGQSFEDGGKKTPQDILKRKKGVSPFVYVVKDNPNATPREVTIEEFQAFPGASKMKLERDNLGSQLFTPLGTAPDLNKMTGQDAFVYMSRDPQTNQLQEVTYSDWYNLKPEQQVRMNRSREEGVALQPLSGEYFKDYKPLTTPSAWTPGTYSFEGGGEMPPQDQMQQVMMEAQTMLQAGATPQEVAQALATRGVPQSTITQILQALMQQAPQMEYGGLFSKPEVDPLVNFNKSVGDTVEFSAGGKNFKGKIKKIENGKFYI